MLSYAFATVLARKKQVSTLWRLRSVAWRAAVVIARDLASIPAVQLPALAIVLCAAAWMAYRVSINTQPTP